MTETFRDSLSSADRRKGTNIVPHKNWAFCAHLANSTPTSQNFPVKPNGPNSLCDLLRIRDLCRPLRLGTIWFLDDFPKQRSPDLTLVWRLRLFVTVEDPNWKFG